MRPRPKEGRRSCTRELPVPATSKTKYPFASRLRRAVSELSSSTSRVWRDPDDVPTLQENCAIALLPASNFDYIGHFRPRKGIIAPGWGVCWWPQAHYTTANRRTGETETHSTGSLIRRFTASRVLDSPFLRLSRSPFGFNRQWGRRGPHHAIPAGLFGGVQGLVGHRDESLPGLPVLRVGGHPDTCGAIHFPPAAYWNRLGDEAATDPFPRDQGAASRGLGEDDGELVAPVPGQLIRGAHRACDHGCEGPQGLIACQVAEGVVHSLEVVDVQEEQGELAPVAPRPLHLRG